jgi:hypothetical protein
MTLSKREFWGKNECTVLKSKPGIKELTKGRLKCSIRIDKCLGEGILDHSQVCKKNGFSE